MNNFIISDEDGSSPSFAVRNFSTEKNHFGSSYTVNQLEIKNRERLRLLIYIRYFRSSSIKNYLGSIFLTINIF